MRTSESHTTEPLMIFSYHRRSLHEGVRGSSRPPRSSQRGYARPTARFSRHRPHPAWIMWKGYERTLRPSGPCRARAAEEVRETRRSGALTRDATATRHAPRRSSHSPFAFVSVRAVVWAGAAYVLRPARSEVCGSVWSLGEPPSTRAPFSPRGFRGNHRETTTILRTN